MRSEQSMPGLEPNSLFRGVNLRFTVTVERGMAGLAFQAIFLLLSAFSCAAAALTVAPDGTLLRDGVPYRALGVNYFDSFTRTLHDPSRTNYNAGFVELARRKIPFARFCGGGFWPSDWALYQTNRLEYFQRFDA